MKFYGTDCYKICICVAGDAYHGNRKCVSRVTNWGGLYSKQCVTKKKPTRKHKVFKDWKIENRF